MIKERLLKIFLALPLFNEIAELAISVFVKHQNIATAFRNFKLGISGQHKENDKDFEYQELDRFHWIIQISSPSGKDSQFWGDTYFAQEIANSLKKLNQEVVVIFRDQDALQFVKQNTVVLNIRGLLPLVVLPKAINAVWVISHPDQITKREMKKYDLVFAASTIWASKKSQQWNLKIRSLLQATNPEVFNTNQDNPEIVDRTLFVGNTRGVFRESVKIASKTIKNLSVIGRGWDKFLDRDMILDNFIDNHELSNEYRKSKVVLNDHWKDMAKNGFISNRLFDAVASGARVISDFVPGSKEIFESSLIEYKTTSDLVDKLKTVSIEEFGTQNQIDSNAKRIQSEHNFDQRAQELLLSVKRFISKQI